MFQIQTQFFFSIIIFFSLKAIVALFFSTLVYELLLIGNK